MKTLVVVKEDIKNIGNTIYQENGMTNIICDGNTCNIEEILLRNILECINSEYKILESEDYIWEDKDGNEVFDICFKTNLPCEEYMAISN